MSPIFLTYEQFAEFLRDFKPRRAAPKRHAHSIDSACVVDRVWAIDLTEHRIDPPGTATAVGHPRSRQPTDADASCTARSIFYRHPSSAAGCHRALRPTEGDPKTIFTPWVFAFALQWPGLHHQGTLPHCPWMNGKIERVWSTLKQVLRMRRSPDDIGLQTTLNLLRDVYNQQRPHQSLSGCTPNEAWRPLIKRKRKPKPGQSSRRR